MCRVPAANMLGAEGEGFKIAMRVLDRGRLHISAVCVGVAERLIADAVAYASERKQFGKPIAEHPADPGHDRRFQDRGARRARAGAGNRRGEGRGQERHAGIGRREICSPPRWSGRVADRAVQIFGGAGYIADYGIERLYRDVRLFRIYEGTSQIQQLIIARETIKARRIDIGRPGGGRGRRVRGTRSPQQHSGPGLRRGDGFQERAEWTRPASSASTAAPRW